ncbi:MAG: hypothetical protein KAR79_06215, partial [Simkaniaceae bacterium]|nr:hypothetical protein [Simkaniaceae bacterium]
NLKKLVPIEDNTCLVLLLLDENPNEQYVSLLSSLQEVGYLLCKFEGLSNLAKTLNPVKIFMEDGDAFIELDQKTALLEDLLNTQENSKKCNSQTKSKNHS